MLEWMHYKSLIDLFYGASGMTINPRKSVFGLQITLQDSLRQVSMLFSYPCKSLEEGLSYLGFHLKPNNNRVGDWNCLIKKSQAKVNRLTPRWILIDGRVTLVTSVLQSIPAYWFSLFIIPMCVIQNLRKIMFHFLWMRFIDCKKFHLASWCSLSRPKMWAGWGIKNLKYFNISLCAKCMWRVLTVMGLWGNIIRSKYMHKIPLELWLCRENFNCSSSSLIWRSLLIGLSYITPNISWCMRRGNCIYIGIDPMVGIAQPLLSNSLLDWLHGKNFVLLREIYVQNEQLAKMDLLVRFGTFWGLGY